MYNHHINRRKKFLWKRFIGFCLIIFFVVGSVFWLWPESAQNKERDNLLNNQVGEAESEPIPNEREEPKGKLSGLTIVLDPGHGGKDGGAVGLAGTLEKDATLKVVQLLKQKLEDHDATIIMTRQGDRFVELEDRVAVTKKTDVDLFLSVHFDAFETEEVNGITTYYHKAEDEKLAGALQQGLFSPPLQTRDRGVGKGDFHVIRENDVPAILFELGYITNEQDEQLINSSAFRETVSDRIVETLIAWFVES